MQMKRISKFILGTIFGSLITLSMYSVATSGQKNSLLVESTKVTIPVDDINNFAKVYAITKSYYVESVTDAKMMKGAIDGMLTNLDPHSSYLDEDEFKQLTEMTGGSFAGLGIQVSGDKDGVVKVIAPIDGTPAYKAGIKSGDYIIKIDGIPVSNFTLDQAVKHMRGKVGTKVSLTISRKEELKPLQFTLTREIIEVHSVKYTMINPNYAYIRISAFQLDTVSNLVKVLQTINQQNTNTHLKGLVLDLRDNPGGLLQAAVGVVGTFVPANSLVVYTAGRAPNSSQKFYAVPDDYNIDGKLPVDLNEVPVIFKTIPMVVLVNQGTASASEIVAGALQDDTRGKIVGTMTFGKGSVQTVLPLSSTTAIKLTTALYYTPKGRSIQAKGIKPDIIVQSEYNDIYNSWDLSEASLDNHLNNPTNAIVVSKDKDSTPIISPPKQITTPDELKAKLKIQRAKLPNIVQPMVATIDIANDFQLQWALNILEGKPLPKNSTTITK